MPLPPAHIRRQAVAFLLERWQERAAEFGRLRPTSLAGACKFVSLWAAEVFGGEVRGNWHHQWVELDGEVLDLTDRGGLPPTVPPPEGSPTAWRAPQPLYTHDAGFWGNPVHLEALASCGPRVLRWVGAWAAMRNAPSAGSAPEASVAPAGSEHTSNHPSQVASPHVSPNTAARSASAPVRSSRRRD